MLSGVFSVFNITIIALLSAFSSQSEAKVQPDIDQRAIFIVIGVDGMSPDGIQHANTPNMDMLMQAGSYSLVASAILPTSSSPNWASMIMGSKPKLHGISSNGWKRKDLEGETFCNGVIGESVPTIFKVLRDKYPLSKIACFHDWNDFGRLIESGVPDIIKDLKGPENTTKEALNYITREKPLFTFIHLDHVDHAGHRYGHGSKRYYQSVEDADMYIGRVIKSLKESGLWDSCYLLVTADHGGKGRRHGGDSPEEKTIPWMLKGPGIREDHQVSTSIVTIDTAPTIADCLGAPLPDCWTGKVISEIFSEK